LNIFSLNKKSLGIVHVLTGPDHLSALATLSVTEKSLRQTFFLGIQWGVGHSTGLMVVGIILLSLQSSAAVKNEKKEAYIVMPTPQISTTLESFVGVFMIGLGIYGFHRSRKKLLANKHLRSQQQYEHSADIECNDTEFPVHDSSPLRHVLPINEQGVSTGCEVHTCDYGATTSSKPPLVTSKYHTHMVPIKLINSDTKNEIMISVQHPGEQNGLENSLSLPLSMSHIQCPLCGSYSTTSLLALIAGIFHGVAGVGGILGVLPAVQMKNPLWGTLYLITFCICSTLTMGCFAMCYGHLFGQCQGLWEFRMECVSACLSIFVGILWLTLLYLGKMEDVFGD
jgi:hypothetical protein